MSAKRARTKLYVAECSLSSLALAKEGQIPPKERLKWQELAAMEVVF